MSDTYCADCGECESGRWGWCRVCREWICPSCKRTHTDEHREVSARMSSASGRPCEALLFMKEAYLND